MSQFLQWFFLAGTVYRLTRVITTDEWPPADWFRNKVKSRFGDDSSWYTLVTCNWCAGAYVGAVVFAWASYFLSIQLPIAQYFTAIAFTGFVGNYDD